jgi:hypothetical protein
MLRASSVPEAAERGRPNDRHVSRVDRLSLKYLQVVNVCNDLVTVHLVWTGAVRRIVRTMFTDPLIASISRPPGDHPRA